MTSNSQAFNLLDEPWVRVRTSAGDVAELSLLELFRTAPELRALAGEIPTQDIAILRLLEAVLLGATKPDRPRSDNESVDLWEALWRAGRLPVEDIDTYLEAHRERFYLLHDQAPFLQVADLHTGSGNASGLVKLIADIPDGHQYFTTRAGREIKSLSFAEAARWLVHCHAFDAAGIKTGAVGDSRVAGGKGYSMGYPAFAGNLGIIIAEGANLFETLMFNLPLPLAGKPSDAPVWERPALTAAVANGHAKPIGPADVFTWPSRRVRLYANTDRIVDVQISNGDLLGPQNQAGNEPMASWRRSPNQSKKAGKDVFMPVTHSPERRIWQGLGSLLVTAEGVSLRAPTLNWLAQLRSEGVLANNQPILLRTVGIEYGPQASSIAGTVDDSLQASVVALTDEALVGAAVDAALRASNGVVALVNLASNLALASGGESARPRECTFEFGFSLLDGPYREWLARLLNPLTGAERVEEWGAQVRRILLDAGSTLIEQAGPAALVGREVPKLGSDSTQLLDAALAEIWFRAALNKALVSKPGQFPEVALWP